MKVLLDIDDKMAIHVMAILNGLPYVKTQQLTNEKNKLLKEIKDAIIEMKKIRSGKKLAQDAEDFLNDL